MILEIFRVFVSLPLALFLPGYFLALIFFKDLESLGKVALGFILTICIDIAVGLFLGYNSAMKGLTGGITAKNLWLYLSIITIVLGIILILRGKKAVHHRKRLQVVYLNLEDNPSHVLHCMEQGMVVFVHVTEYHEPAVKRIFASAKGHVKVFDDHMIITPKGVRYQSDHEPVRRTKPAT